MEPNNLEQPIEPTPNPEPTEPAPTTPDDNVPTPTSNPKNSKVLLATTIITSILALAGIGASIYFFMDSNNKSTEISTLNSKIDALQAMIDSKNESSQNSDTPETPKPSEEEVSSIVSRYFVDRYSIIESGLDSVATKAFIAFHNLPESQIEYTDTQEIVSYDNLNREYKNLFGAQSDDLPRQDITAFSRGPVLKYDDNQYSHELFAIGSGAGYTDYKIIDYVVNQNNLIVNVAYLEAKLKDDNQSCEVVLVDGESIPFPCNYYTVQSVKEQKETAENLFSQYSSRLANYQMIFSKENSGNYALTTVTKTN